MTCIGQNWSSFSGTVSVVNCDLEIASCGLTAVYYIKWRYSIYSDQNISITKLSFLVSKYENTVTKCYHVQGRPSSSEAMMHFPLFQISPLFAKNFQTPWEFFSIFPQKNVRFHPPKMSDDPFLVIHWKFCISPRKIVHFPSISRKLFFSPYFFKFPPDFIKFMGFLHTLHIFRSPLVWPWCIYASPYARTGRPWPYQKNSHKHILTGSMDKKN